MSRLLTLAILSLGLVAAAEAADLVTRPPAVAGTFYPSDSTELSRMVASHLSAVDDPPTIDGDIIAIVVPHAGMMYSGPVAVYCYKLLAGRQISKVILCGPAHRVGFSGLSVYGPQVAWKTPLGLVSCNDQLCRSLLKSEKLFKNFPDPQLPEHSLEVQLPYLQTVLDRFEIVPIVMGYQEPATITALADALASLPFDSSTIFIASTDWQHYRPASTGGKMDSLGMACLSRLDLENLQKYFADGSVEACGAGPLIAVLKAAISKGADHVKILKYGDSGDITGDKSSVVGYVAAVIYRAHSGNSGSTKEQGSLTEADKQRLCQIARQSIQSYLKDGKVPVFELSDLFKRNGAAFVTLNKEGQLRGCIGMTEALMPLGETVAHCAVSAAVSDPRFRPDNRRRTS